jgi:hypothetical protein
MDSKEQSDLYFERLASELEALADAIGALRVEDRALAGRLKDFAGRIRTDSGLPQAAPVIAFGKTG